MLCIPYGSKEDLANIKIIPENTAAMTWSLDENVGKLLGKLKEGFGDGGYLRRRCMNLKVKARPAHYQLAIK
jgi:hypothetical protein